MRRSFLLLPRFSLWIVILFAVWPQPPGQAALAAPPPSPSGSRATDSGHGDQWRQRPGIKPSGYG